jgi:hypothetical protein
MPGEQTVIFDADANLQQLVDNPVSNRSILIGFLQFCAANPVITRNHSRFQIPLKVTCDSSLPITKQSQLGELLCKTSLIIWDEAPTQHTHCAEAVSRCLQFLRNDERPFGGVTMVFAGDWAQTLPVVPRGSVANIMNPTLQSSELWAPVEQLKLTEKMRLQRRGITEQEAEEMRRFADWLLEVGAGRCNDNNGHVILPPYIRVISPDDGLPALTAAT